MDNKRFKKILSKMTMFDDSFMSVCFDNNIPLATLVLRIILGREDIIVTEVKSQYSISTIKNRNCRLDVKMRDEDGKIYDVEIQNKTEGASPERARYYSSILDSKILKSGDEVDKLVETYVIFIIKTDYYKRGLPLYKIDRYIDNIDGKYESFNDGSHIIYVNGSYRGENDIGLLMEDFNECESKKMHYEEVREITKEAKNEVEIGGRSGMSDSLREAIREEYKDELAVAREKAEAKGIAKGKTNGIQELLSVVKKYKMGNITKEDAVKQLGITIEEFNVILK